MDILVSYDVNTESTAGKRRLRKAAKICQSYGQRVQYSVFECRVTDMQYEEMIAKFDKLIDKDKDSLRFYRLFGDRTNCVYVLGRDHYIDFEEPLII